VHREWREAAIARARRRRAAIAGVLLAAAAALFIVVRVLSPEDIRPPAATAIAQVERVQGAASIQTPTPPESGPAGPEPTRERAAASGEALSAGDTLQTAVSGGVTIRLSARTSVRVDAGSRLRLTSASVLTLERGAVYVDTGAESGGLEIRTPLGTARDIGTQFEVRLEEASLRLRVRTGVVELQRDDRRIHARPGTEVLMDAAGIPRTASMAPFGSDWDWVARLAPPAEFEGRPLASCLEFVAREQGWTLRYDEPALARDASGIILHGSFRDLLPLDALAVALRTSGLEHRVQDGELVVFRPRR
jgi:ferric-dicitrate binding protein FerR (iron transport regulator)